MKQTIFKGPNILLIPISFVVLVVTSFFIIDKIQDYLNRKNTYRIGFYLDTNKGANVGDSVKVLGLNCGWVDSIYIQGKSIGGSLRIRDHCMIPDDSEVIVTRDQKLLSSRIISINPGLSTTRADSVVITSINETSGIIKAFEGFSNLVNTVDTLLQTMKKVQENQNQLLKIQDSANPTNGNTTQN